MLEISKVPAKYGLLQVCALSLYSKIQQSVSEIGESLWRILEIFPFCRDASRRRGAISTAWWGTQSNSSFSKEAKQALTDSADECLLLAAKQKCREQVAMSLNDHDR